MNNILHEIAEIVSKGFEKDIKRLVEKKQDISQFVLEVKKGLDEVGVLLIKEAFEILDEAVKAEKSRKKKWYIHGINMPNSLNTIFGVVKYERTYYKNKETGEYKYLSDELVGIEAHDKSDTLLKAKCIENGVNMPYRKSGELATDALTLSGQTVMNSIRELGKVSLYEPPEGTIKKRVKNLFIEADEDHVSMRGKRCGEPKLVYVHEGIKEISKGRYELKNPKYFGGMFKNTEELWVAVEDYIDECYEREEIEKIYLSGDRGLWIRNGGEWIKDSIYVVDKYHLLKYVKQAAAHIEKGCDEIWTAIENQDREYLEVVLETIKEHPDSEIKLQRVIDASKYIMASFESTKHYYDEEYNGCSAEGHISHIYSDRLSSRPRIWSEIGIDEMARLRVYVKNGGEIFPLLLKKKSEKRRNLVEIEANMKIIDARKKVASGETLSNLPIINSGKICESLRMLKSFRYS